jgi:ABC-type sugar transport system substrate-binding protein
MLVLSPAALSQGAAEAARVVFVNPAPPGDPFWDRAEQAARAAAVDLGLHLTVVHANNSRYQTRSILLDLARHAEPPDYVVFEAPPAFSTEILAALASARIHAIALGRREQLGEDHNARAGPSPYILKEVFFDQVEVGRIQAKALLAAARERRAESGCRCSAVAIGGGRDVAGLARIRGLESVFAQQAEYRLRQSVYSYWQPGAAREQATIALYRYPDLGIIWTASDRLALAAVDAVKALNVAPGQDVMIAGIDWLPEAVAAVSRGELVVTIGGHFMAGAWSLVQIYDHHRGIRMHTHPVGRWAVVDKNNAGMHQKRLQNPRWHAVDFRGFTLTHNPGARVYHFDVHRVMEQL